MADIDFTPKKHCSKCETPPPKTKTKKRNGRPAIQIARGIKGLILASGHITIIDDCDAELDQCKKAHELHGEFASPEFIEYIKGLAK